MHLAAKAKQCGVHEVCGLLLPLIKAVILQVMTRQVLTLYDSQCTKDAVRRAIRSAGRLLPVASCVLAMRRDVALVDVCCLLLHGTR